MTCAHSRQLLVAGKASDSAFFALPDGTEREGYVVSGIGFGSGDYFEIDVCLDCKQVVGMPDADVVVAAVRRK